MQAVFLDKATLPAYVDINWSFACECYDSTSAEQVLTRAADAEIIISNKVRLNDEMLAQLPKLKLIVSAATGVDHIDSNSCKSRGIALCNVREYANDSVAEHCLMLMLALSRKLTSYHQRCQQGEWARHHNFTILDQPLHTLNGKTLGIIGYGALGKQVTKLAKAFGMQVLIAEGSSDTPARTPLPTLLAQADIISLHCPAIANNPPLVNKHFLSQLKPTALLINTARGALVDEQALLHALQQRQLAGAALDVLCQEPPGDGSAYQQLRLLDNVIITPHQAWGSVESIQRLLLQIEENVIAFNEGKRLRRVV